ncbi:hypothetical protein AYI69_g2574 [Smittium culicis]|uniref:Uncharacterized protein n=1 Tax=Smittium culicis TaxID=133412 RepID=A0A1R1YM14_9FUNG|nr:hypothetical protein AYI69_g2574 [Smittium culicis]
MSHHRFFSKEKEKKNSSRKTSNPINSIPVRRIRLKSNSFPPAANMAPQCRKAALEGGGQRWRNFFYDFDPNLCLYAVLRLQLSEFLYGKIVPALVYNG